MSSLWTPRGEHRVPRDQAGGPDDRDDRPPAPDAGDDAREAPHVADDGAPTEEEQLQQLAELRAQILATPASEVIANHAFGLFELAAIHLSAERPAVAEARLAIDALAALVETLGDRLGRNAATLRDGLSQIRLAFVNIAQAGGGGDGESSGPAGGTAG